VGWHVIRGAAKGFRSHGYCADDSWIVKLTESEVNQLNPEGTLHATVDGNRFDAGLVYTLLRRHLHPGDRTRPPAP
jgi:hypothetical protein